MSKACIFLATGFEETEAIAVIDILRRGRVEVTTVSMSDSHAVMGRSRILVTADKMWEDAQLRIEEADMLILPGGQPGVTYLGKHKGLQETLEKAAKEDKRISAICAAPVVLGHLGILKGKKATGYPGTESELEGAILEPRKEVVKDGHLITSRGVGTAIPFALKLVEVLQGKSVAEEIRREIVYQYE